MRRLMPRVHPVMISKGILIYTVLKIARNPFLILMASLLGIGVPLCMCLVPPSPFEAAEPTAIDSYFCALIFAFVVVTSSNCVGNAVSVGGRGDYLPLIFTRPLNRYTFVFSKWLSIAIAVAAVSLLQYTIMFLTGALEARCMTSEMIACGFVERITDSLSVAAIMMFVYLLPSQTYVLIGILAVEFAVFYRALSQVSFLAANPTEGIASDIFMFLEVLGVRGWFEKVCAPMLFGPSASIPLDQCVYLFKAAVEFLSPVLNIYDLFGPDPISNCWLPLAKWLWNVSLAVLLTIIVVNSREYHYGAD